MGGEGWGGDGKGYASNTCCESPIILVTRKEGFFGKEVAEKRWRRVLGTFRA